jgi:hypothetical protein
LENIKSAVVNKNENTTATGFEFATASFGGRMCL